MAVEAVRDVEDRDVSRRVSSVSALAAAAAKGSLLAVPGAEVERWGYEIELPPGFDYSLVDETTERQLSEWIGLGHVSPVIIQSRETRKTAVLILPTARSCSARLPGSWARGEGRAAYASAYALSVAQLRSTARTNHSREPGPERTEC